MRLKYKSLVTKENIEHYLSIIEDDSTKRDLISTASKIDIRISTKPVIKGEEFYYKIWIIRKGTKKKAHIKQYYPLKLLKKKTKLLSSPHLTLAEIFDMVRINADVPDDFEEYCELRFEDPSDEICRIDYLADLKRAKRFKKFLTEDEIRSIPSLPEEDNNDNYCKLIEEKKERFEIINKIKNDEESKLRLLGYSIVFLNDKREYDELVYIQTTLEYYDKITESYGFDRYTNEFNEKLFPITKDDKQIKKIMQDIENYNQLLIEYKDYLKQLIKKYNIKQAGNTIKRVAFNLITPTDSISQYQFVTTVIDYRFFY
ncbi:MAG: hypothetical protein ACR2F1_03230 [Nitrososphaeraceae archaeon]